MRSLIRDNDGPDPMMVDHANSFLEARALAAQLAPETSDMCIGHYGTHADHEEPMDEPCPLHRLLVLLTEAPR